MKYIGITFIVVLVIACQKTTTIHTVINSAKLVEFKDPRVHDFIDKFVESENLNSKDVILYLDLAGDSRRKVYYLSSSNFQISEKSKLPLHYAIINEFLVFVSSDIDYAVKNDNLNFTFYTNLIDSMGVKLSDKYMFVNDPYWHAVSCEESFEIREKRGTEEYSLPCNYHLERNVKMLDSIRLVKDWERN